MCILCPSCPVTGGYSMAPGVSGPYSFWCYLSLSLLPYCPLLLLLPPPTSDFLLHLVGRYTTSHWALDCGVQQCLLRHGGTWTP